VLSGSQNGALFKETGQKIVKQVSAHLLALTFYHKNKKKRMMKFNKKAISTLVAYSLLIGISIAMAGSVYVWLKFYVSSPLTTESCPSEVSIIISDYCCNAECGPDLPAKTLNLTVQNHGYFNISGYIIKMNTDPSDKVIAGKYSLCAGAAESCNGDNYFSDSNGIPTPLAPTYYNSTVFNYTKYSLISVIQIEPYRIVTSKNGKQDRVFCEKALITQKLSCG